MSIATEKNKRSTERFMLVRLTPARYIGGDLTDQGSGIYTASFNYPVEKVQRNGVDLTKDTLEPSVDDHYYHDETTGTLTLKLAASPDEDTNVIVVFYYIFLTGDKTRVARETPTNTTAPLRPWLPRLDEYPTLRQSSSNNLFGVFTIDATSINFRNADHFFEQFLTDNDSFTGKAVDIWYCLNDVSNITAAYRGNVSGVSSSMGILTLEIFDQFSLLESLPFMGDTADEAFFLKTSSSFANISDEDSGKPVRYIMGSYQGNVYKVDENWTKAEVARNIVPGNDAICTQYNPTVSNSVNRLWGICRIDPAKKKFQSVGTIVNRTVLSSTTRRIEVTSHNFELLQPVAYIVDGLYSHEFVDDIQDVGSNIYIFTKAYDGSSLTNGTTFSVPADEIPPTVWLVRGEEHWLLEYLNDYTYTTAVTSGGNLYYSVQLGSGLSSPETNHSLSDPIDPLKDKIIFRMPVEQTTHAEAAKLLCEGVGLEIDQDTFDQADADYAANALFSVPFITETEYQNSRHYLEALLNSTMGFLYITPENKVGYKLFKAPIGGSSVTKKEVIRDSMSLRVDFYDVYDQIIARNPHVARLSPYDPALPSESISSKKAKYLHGISKVKDFDHVLEKIGDRLDLMLAVYSNRKTFYSYQSTIGAIETALADDLTLMSEVSGADSDKNLIVTSVTKGADTIDIEATDLIGVE